ncbi:MAG: DUF429 domain-containing protein [Acidimicrobiales bacterium]|nr:DUF429 domain-containing protein [Acidimicrobiales bacterium]
MTTNDRAGGPLDVRTGVGIDVGARLVHAVALAASASDPLVVTGLFTGPPGDRSLVAFCASAARIAVDAPSEPSAGAHLADSSVAPKFRPGRCSEIPVAGVPPVSWVTPRVGEPVAGWMAAGFSVWQDLREAGHETVETFPAAAYHRLNGGRWPPRKTGLAGRAARIALLACAGLVLPPDAGAGPGWSHDQLDAAVAAVVALRGRPVPHHCPNPDGSSLWLVP